MSNKRPIAWHEECLLNRVATVRRMYDAIQEDMRHYALARGNALVYEAQIKRAKARGLDGFDAERFGIKYRRPIKTTSGNKAGE